MSTFTLNPSLLAEATEDEGGVFDGYYFFGIILIVMASICGTIGKLLMKAAHTHNSRSKLILGLVFTAILNPVFFVAAYAFAAQSLLVPLSGMGIVFNTLMAPRFLGETLTRQDYIGCATIFLGCTLVAISGPKSSQDYTAAELRSLYSESTFIAFAVAQAVWFVVLVSYYRRVSRMDNDDVSLHPDHSPVAVVVARPTNALTNSSSPSPPASLTHHDPTSLQMQRGILAAAIGGTLGGNHYFVKSVTELLKDTYNGNSALWTNFATYLIIAGAVSATAGGLVMLHKALKYHHAVHVVPVYQSLLIIVGSVSAAAYFDEWDTFSPWQYALFPVALLICIVGIALLSTSSRGLVKQAAADQVSPATLSELQLSALSKTNPLDQESTDDSDSHHSEFAVMEVETQV